MSLNNIYYIVMIINRILLKIAQQAGMIIPPNKDLVRHFNDNIHYYRDVITID